MTVDTTDTTPPDVTVITPNGGEAFDPERPTPVAWTATDASGIAYVDVFASFDSGATFSPIALALTGTNGLTWYPPIRPTVRALVKVEATDPFLNTGADVSDLKFTINAPTNGLVPTTLRDFDQPGTQPFEHGLDIRDPGTDCAACHGNYDAAVEPYRTWRGSMMANAARDPLFKACLAIANQDAPASGDLCIRCHSPRAWVNGRSTPTDGSLMTAEDRAGISCDLCHRMVDPVYDPAANPPEDQAILAGLSSAPTEFGNGTYVIDPSGARRGPFSDVTSPHEFLVSPFHQEAAFCGVCHDVSNPAFETDGMGNYVPNALDQAATDFSPHTLMPIERTYSEWLYSDYNSPAGVFAPEFGGNLDFVSTCQDCHMRDATGAGCTFAAPRADLPIHDLTGGSTWLPGLFASLFPGEIDPAAQQATIDRARYMLQNAAQLDASIEGTQLKITVTNNTGHKLPTGYPEGRRMWLNLRFVGTNGQLIDESGAYDPATGVLTHDPAAKIYETELGPDATVAALTGLPVGPSFHFVLNNKVYKDNRIPPRGFINANYSLFGGAPVGHAYADGQFWDDTFYDLPPCTATVEVTLYYQSTSKEYVDFLRDENTTNTAGQELFDLWNNNGKCPPEIMASVNVTMPDCNANTLPDGCEALAGGDFDANGVVDLADYAALPDCLAGPDIAPLPAQASCTATCLAAFDADTDGDVDLDDFQSFQQAFAN